MLSIISTVGTTVFGGFGSPLNNAVKQFEQSQPKDTQKIIDGKSFPGQEIYQQALADLKAKSGSFLRKACAEINAIEGFHNKYGVALGNQYHFLASHTATGMLAARVLRDFCLERYQASYADVRLVQGLQVQDAHKFRLEGLPFLIQVIYEVLTNAQEKRLTTVLNPTGGFKAAIPYITLVGMIRRVEVGLIHETSEALITLAGLPIALDLEAIAQISPVLEQCDAEQETGIHRTTLAQGLGLSRNEMVESHPLWSLFGQYGSDHYILSGLGSIALAELRVRAKHQRVWLSKQATERFDELDRNLQDQLSRIFEQMRDSDWIKINLHATGKDHLKILKPSGAERPLFYWADDGSVVIADIGLKNDGSYDRISDELDTLKRVDYPPFSLWEKKQR
jgi:putative CRISPR-associated protein (TIGR02619 family)